MKRINFIKLILILILLSPTAAGANCIWDTGNCTNLGGTNTWGVANSENSCSGTTKPDPAAKCCCGAEITGCCEKTDNSGNKTAEDLTAEKCKKITYATTNFYQDKKAAYNACTDKGEVSCQWRNVDQNYKICAKNEYTADDNRCVATAKPSDGQWNYICCCGAATSVTKPATAPNPPKFIMPELQIPIPGLNLTSSSTITANATLKADGSYSFSIPWLAEYIAAIYHYGLSIAGILAAIMLMAGGALWLISGGDASRVTQAKELIAGSVTGLIILFSSYIILYQINPDLTQLAAINLGTIKKLEFQLSEQKLGTTADQYMNMGCPSNEELAAGVQFYATGYFKWPYQTNQDLRYLCNVHMNGTCPNGTDTSQTCVENGAPIFPKWPNWHPCRAFNQEQYNSNYFTQAGLTIGQTVAGPIKCGGKLAKGNQICFKGNTYTITDSGDAIQGKRIDILSASLQDSIKNSGLGILKSGPCF